MSIRTGFLARGMHPFGCLIVSFGYGFSGEGEAVVTPEEGGTRVGRPGLYVRGETKDGPEFTLKVKTDDEKQC